MRIGLWLFGLASAIAAPALADDAAPALDAYAALTSVAPRRSNCAAGRDSGEIVVCGRRRDNLRYRLPPSVPTPGTRAARTPREERFALQQYRAEGGIGSCSAVGPGGALGCLNHRFREAEERGDPGLISRVLTYLDPDE